MKAFSYWLGVAVGCLFVFLVLSSAAFVCMEAVADSMPAEAKTAEKNPDETDDEPTLIYVDRLDFITRLHSEDGPVWRTELHARNWDGPRQVHSSGPYAPSGQWPIPHALYIDWTVVDTPYRWKRTDLGTQVWFTHHDRRYLVIARDTACGRGMEDGEAIDAARRPRHYRRGLPWSRDGKTIYFKKD